MVVNRNFGRQRHFGTCSHISVKLFTTEIVNEVIIAIPLIALHAYRLAYTHSHSLRHIHSLTHRHAYKHTHTHTLTHTHRE